MTEPTDAELIAVANAAGLSEFTSLTDCHELGNQLLMFARVVLAKWGTPPAPALVPCGFCELAGVPACKPDSEHEAERECGQNNPAIIATTQPTQAQAGAVPLTDGQAKEVLWAEHLRWMRAAGLDTEGMRPTGEWLDHWLTYVRAIERAHGIGIKGGQHAE